MRIVQKVLSLTLRFDEWLFFGRFIMVPFSFYFTVMDLMVLQRMFKVWDIFLKPNLD